MITNGILQVRKNFLNRPNNRKKYYFYNFPPFSPTPFFLFPIDTDCSELALVDVARNCQNVIISEKYKTYVDNETNYCFGDRNLTFGGKAELYTKVPLGAFKKPKKVNSSFTY